MSALLDAELRRALSRRVVRIVAAIMLLIIAATGLGVFLTADTENPAVQVRRELLDLCIQSTGDVTSCEAETPTIAEIEAQGFFSISDDPRFELTELWPDDPADEENGILPTLSLLGFFVALVIGASLVGAEYRAGTMETLLTWEPRRVRVVVTKLATAAVVAFGFYLGFQVLLSLALLPTAVFRGVTEGADGAWLGHLVGSSLRTGAIVAGLAVVGGSLAMIARNTGGAIAFVFAYLIGVEIIVRNLRDGWEDWFVLPNILLVMGLTPSGVELSRSTAGAVVVLLCYLAVLVAVTTVTFRTRDLG